MEVVACMIAGALAAEALPHVVAVAPHALAAVAGAWCALRPGRPGRSRRLIGGHLALLAVFLLGALRPGGAGVPPGAEAALSDALRSSRDAETVEGTWEVERSGRGFAWGTVGEHGTSFRLPTGLIEDGERVLVLPGAPPRTSARGPALPAGPPARPRRDLRPDEVVRLAPRRGLRSPFEALRSHLLERTHRFEQPRTRALARALVCGDTGELEPGLSDLFVRTGLRHLLAVSGMHVAWVALLFAAPLGWLVARLVRREWRARVLAAVAIACVLVYAELAGGAAPVRRAATAASLIFASPLIPLDPGRRGRRADGLTLWSLALLFELALDPRALDGLSVQLSYAATLGLLIATRPIARGLSRSLGGFGERVRPDRTGVRIPLVRLLGRGLARGLLLAVAASCAAVLATLPIAWTRFGEWSPLGLLATPLVAPCIAYLLTAGWAVVLTDGLVPAAVFEAPAQALLGVLARLDDLPGTPIPLPERPVLALVVAVAGTLAAAHMAERGTRSARALAGGAALAWGLVLLPWTATPARVELVALDVGHGSALVLRGPGLGCWVFDAGSRDRSGVARRALAPLLARWEVTRPGVVLSHGDADHAGALGWLIERYTPHTWVGALPAPLGERLPHTTPRIDLERGRLRLPTGGVRGPRLVLLRGRPGNNNEGSRSLLLELDTQRVLLCGDAEGEGLAALLREDLIPGPSRLLLLPHHGSESPWMGRLLATARPERVWVSAGGPPPVARELDRRGLDWACTAVGGPLRLELGPLASGAGVP